MDKPTVTGRLSPSLEPRDDAPLILVEHVPDLLGEAHGFGGFLFDLDGRLVKEGGRTWLYTTALSDGIWESWVRSFDLTSLRAGPKRRILVPEVGNDRAVLHHVIAVSNNLIVGLYCDQHGVRAAIARQPDAEFVPDPTFALRPQLGWETRGGGLDGCTLEVNGAHVLCEDDGPGVEFWQGYDSYRKAERIGDLGWVRLRVDRTSRRVISLGRHPGNPLSFRHPEWACARCGGNLASDLSIRGKHPFFYYIRPSLAEAHIRLTLSNDRLFQSGLEHHALGPAMGAEDVVEKFEAIAWGNEILLFHESQFRDGSWRTGMRRYEARADDRLP